MFKFKSNRYSQETNIQKQNIFSDQNLGNNVIVITKSLQPLIKINGRTTKMIDIKGRAKNHTIKTNGIQNRNENSNKIVNDILEVNGNHIGIDNDENYRVSFEKTNHFLQGSTTERSFR